MTSRTIEQVRLAAFLLPGGFWFHLTDLVSTPTMRVEIIRESDGYSAYASVGHQPLLVLLPAEYECIEVWYRDSEGSLRYEEYLNSYPRSV